MADSFAKPTSFHEALEQFENMERELDLPNWHVKDVYVWKLIRFSLFRRYRMIHGLVQDAHPEEKRLRKTKKQIIKDFPERFIKRNPFIASRENTDRIIIPSGRKRWIDDQFIEPYSARAWQGVLRTRSLILDRTSPLNPASLPGAQDYEVMVRLGWIAQKFVRVSFDYSDRSRMNSIKQWLSSPLNIDGRSFEEMVLGAIRTFIGQRSVFRALYKKTQPNALYVVCAYGLAAPVAAAQEQGIVVAEFQHGSMDRGHLGYDFRTWEEVPYFPDHLLTWGEAWYRDTTLPQHCTMHLVGAPYIEMPMRQALNGDMTSEKKLLVLSQGPVAEMLLEAVIEFSCLRPDWNIVVRPHPSENVASIRSYLQKIDRDTVGRIHVENDSSLVEACGQASVVFGVSSTALVESLLSGCKVVILRIPNAPPYFQSLLDEGEARAVQSGVELADCIEALTRGSARSYFAEPVEDVCSMVESSGND